MSAEHCWAGGGERLREGKVKVKVMRCSGQCLILDTQPSRRYVLTSVAQAAKRPAIHSLSFIYAFADCLRRNMAGLCVLLFILFMMIAFCVRSECCVACASLCLRTSINNYPQCCTQT